MYFLLLIILPFIAFLITFCYSSYLQYDSEDIFQCCFCITLLTFLFSITILIFIENLIIVCIFGGIVAIVYAFKGLHMFFKRLWRNRDV